MKELSITTFQKGQIFKNFRGLCEYLEIDYDQCKCGNSKKAIIKEIQRYADIHTMSDKRRWKVYRSYDAPLPPIDKRANKTGKYTQHIDALLSTISSIQEKTYTQLYSFCGLTNDKYLHTEITDNIFANYDLNEFDFSCFSNVVSQEARQIIDSSLDRLQKNTTFLSQYTYIIKSNNNESIATDEQNKYIQEETQNYLNKIHQSIQYVNATKKRRQTFYAERNTQLLHKHNFSISRRVILIINDNPSALENTKFKEIQKELNQLFRERLSIAFSNKYDAEIKRAKKEVEKIVIGQKPSVESRMRLPKDYLQKMQQLTDIFCEI